MPPRRATRSSSSTKSKPATPSKPASTKKSTKKAPVKRGRSKKEEVKEEAEEEEEEQEEEQQEEVVEEAPTKRPRRAARDRSGSDDMTDDNGFNLQWSTHGSLLVLSNDELSKGNTKIAAFDMDGTLIRPKSGKVFPQGRNDWVLLFPEVATKLRELHEDGYKLVIFTNQNGISTGTQPKGHITGKIQDLIRHFNVPMLAFVATADDLYRKPAIDMWTYFTKNYNGGVPVDLSKSWYVGDAAGRAKSWDGNAKTKKDFSCGDRKFAKNVGVNFGTPEEFFLSQKPAPFSWGGVDLSSHIAEDVKDGSHTSATAVKAASKASAAVATSHGEAKAAFEGSLGLGEEQEIVVFVGFPAAGKSTFARKWFVPAGYVHVNQDTLKTKEKCIKITRESVADGKSVVVDNTNGDPTTRAQYIAIAKDAGIRIRCCQFLTTMELAQHMNMFREKFVGIKHVSRIAYNMYKSKFKAPTTSEGFAEVKTINFVAHFDDDKAKQLFYQMT